MIILPARLSCPLSPPTSEYTVVNSPNFDEYTDERHGEKEIEYEDGAPDSWRSYAKENNGRSPAGETNKSQKWLTFIWMSIISIVFGIISGQSYHLLSRESPIDNPEDINCGNPYDTRGVLLVNLTVASGNVWEPIDESCSPPIDWMSLLIGRDESSRLDFARNKTIILFGDSIDRNNNVYFCSFLGGHLEFVGPDHSVSPPYPPGEEIPPVGYVNAVDGTESWAVFDQSRPFICTIPTYNLRIISFFHYGHFEGQVNPEMLNLAHYYPPHRTEDRFQQIILPLLKNLDVLVPDIISFSPGFWGLFRYAQMDQTAWHKLLEEGHSETEEQVLALTDFRELSERRRRRFEKRTRENILEIARAWEGEVKRPTILFRELHHVKQQGTIPYHRVQAFNQIALQVVESLIKEDTALFQSGSNASLGLKERLIVDHWGSNILGQEHHFKDNIHPLPLPTVFLYGNMLMEQLSRI